MNGPKVNKKKNYRIENIFKRIFGNSETFSINAIKTPLRRREI